MTSRPLLLLASREVEVWKAPLDLPPADLHRLTGCLSSDERRRWRRFATEADGARWAAGRAWLRVLLGRRLGTDPGRLQLYGGGHTRPSLVPDGEGREPLRFNLSRSANLALYALSPDRAVGVDVEATESGIDVEAVALRFFSPREGRLLRAMSPAARRRSCFEWWTAKEAYLKGLGCGLAVPLDSFDVAGDDLPPPRRTDRGRIRPLVRLGSWSLAGFDPGPGYTATVAWENWTW